ncbi:GP46-like surface antigen, putative [Bodo saltans]|uniref:GP46-like surface antigen, putative n=1 Tax=Bodo saltans TaxID=75058 RepID=A0A0S4IQE4_BODSA|nr:GP46-like surface antigen, putative [Bodo saltans]|eukprot:CUF20798.1 GP46-like surface antigen, putative [Bodo saltans]
MMRWCRGAALLLLFLCSCLLFCPCPSCSADGATLQAEVDIVAQFFTVNGFANITALTTENLCSGWPAMISCNADRVSALNFRNINLRGTLPTGLSGLEYLSSLVVSDNQLTGSIPFDLCRSGNNLMNLQMGGNLLSGSLPPEWSNCRSMKTFNVSSNSFSGIIPAAYSAWGMSITSFEVSANNFTGTLPLEFSNWTIVSYFAVSRNQLSGTLPPEYSSMKALTYFDINMNYLTGALPEDYQQLRGMNSFRLSDNRMSGTLPSVLAAWLQISSFRVDNNRLTGTFPSEYAAWQQIDYFDAGNNSFTGSLPPEYANWTQIMSFYVNNNFLSGTLPPQYGNGWMNILVMTVQNNSIIGTLPADYSLLAAVSVFNVALNLMTGALPSQYGAWMKVSQLYLHGNAFTGSIPLSWCTGMTYLQVFTVFNNKLSGTIPLMTFPLLSTLAMSFNDFSGTLPTFASLPILTTLDVQNNTKLSGPIVLPKTTSMISSCGTQLCMDQKTVFLQQVCLPSGVIATAIGAQPATIVALLRLCFVLNRIMRRHHYVGTVRSNLTTTTTIKQLRGTKPNSNI